MTEKRNIPYQGISLPVPIINEIKKHIKNRSYTTATDFIKAAIREKISRDINLSGEVFGGVKIEKQKINEEIQKNIDKTMEEIFGKDTIRDLKRLRKNK